MVKKIVLHTVHGTWPNGPWGWRLWKPFRGLFRSNTPWYDPESDFCKAVARNTNAQLEFVPFQWDGCNSFKARARAADDLREHLRYWFNKEGEARHFIVAHSHGGTVAF